MSVLEEQDFWEDVTVIGQGNVGGGEESRGCVRVRGPCWGGVEEAATKVGWRPWRARMGDLRW